MKKESTTETNLEDIVRSVQRQELLLPDFQRGFVWDIEKQKRLVASVLARMPIGSILTLEADSDEYGCKVLGRKDLLELKEKKENIYVLLDGQQRMTSLANVFSNLIYWDYENKNGLINSYKSLASVDLQNRFFLRIPRVDKLEKKEDLFGFKDLKFPLNNVEKEVPDFLTDVIEKFIEVVSFNGKTDASYIPGKRETLEIMRDCIRNDCYWIPLFLLIEDNEGERGNHSIINKILYKMVEEVIDYRVEHEYANLEKPQKIAYIKENIEDVHWEDIIGEDQEINEQKLIECWRRQGEQEWGQHMLQYLQACIRKMELHQIVVEKSKRDRAIDIYENLNLGGITLSTFELVLAKAAKNKFSEGKNLHNMIVEHIQKDKKDEYDQSLLPEEMVKHYGEFISREGRYSATDYMGCFNPRKNELNKKYTEAFLNVLSLLSYAAKYKEEYIDLSMIKREKILKLDANHICENYERACVGVDRACYFLQVRCGIRKITEVHYNLIIVLLGYMLANDEFYHDKKIIKRLEAWYWIVIFSGRYDKDQNKNVITDLKSFLGSINGKDQEYSWLKEWKKRVFDMPGFSDEETLLLQTSVIPKNVIKNTICQYHLAKTYRDIIEKEEEEKVLHTLAEDAATYEEHHIVPLGNLTSDLKKCEKEKRNDKTSIFNSPLNFALISRQANKMISNHTIEYYIQYCNDGTIFELNLEKDCAAIDDETTRKLLCRRFKKTKAEVEKKINILLG